MSQKAVRASKPEGRVALSRSDRFSVLSMRLFRGPATRLVMRMPSLGQGLAKSRMRMTPLSLVSVAMLSTLLAGIVSALVASVGLYLGFPILGLGLLAPPVVFVVVLFSPKASASGRASAIDNELPFLMGYFSVLASGGVSPISTLRKISKMADTFPASSREAKQILMKVDTFGSDPITAIQEAAATNPNRTFAEFLYGYTTVLKTGGDFMAYIGTKLKEIFSARESKIRRTSDTTGTLAEAYVSVTALLGISLFTIYQVQAILAHTSGGLGSVLIFSFLVVPLLSAVFIWILDGVQPKQPYVDYRPYKQLLLSMPVGMVILAVPLAIPLFLHISAALAVGTALPSYFSVKYSRERSGLERKLPDFIRDIAEGRKIGLAPETNIETLASKDYGPLSKYVHKMGAQLSWGISISNVLETFTRGVKSWLTKVTGTLMLEVVEVGGGTVRSFTDMADFTRKINDLESEKRSTLRPYLFVTYLAGLMVVATTFLMIYFISFTGKTATMPGQASVSPGTIDLLLTAAIFESWMAGLVAGKMGEGSIAEGFKHSFLLVVASVVMIYVAQIFINIPI